MGLFRKDKKPSSLRGRLGVSVPKKRVLKYKVVGTNPATGRRKTVKDVIVGSWERLPASIPGIDPPYDFVLDLPEVTDAQLAVFKQNKISPPAGMHRLDATVAIMHIVAENPVIFEAPLPDAMLEEAVRKQLFMPSFLSEQEARNFLAGREWRTDQ